MKANQSRRQGSIDAIDSVLNNNSTITHFIRFLIVGLSNTAISFAVFHICIFALPDISWRGTLGQCVSYGVGIFWSFFFNRYWTFQPNLAISNTVPRFVLAQLFCLALSASLVGIAVDLFGQNPTLSWIIIMSFITMINFSLLKFWVFIPSLADKDP